MSGIIHSKTFHVSVNGTFDGSGSSLAPRSLQRALEVHMNYVDAGPGDTVLIHQGDYYGSFSSWIHGEKDNPVVVMPFENDVVRIIGTGAENSTLSINGRYAIFRDLIITQSERNRDTGRGEVNAEAGVSLGAEGVKLVNCIIHDIYGVGVGGSSNAVNAEINGCIIFNIGYKSPERGIGHGMYLSNNTGEKEVVNNIVFNTYGHGIQFYTEGAQQLNPCLFENNIIFNAGILASESGVGEMRNYMMGGNVPTKGLKMIKNYSYQPPNSVGNGMVLGYNVDSESCVVNDNYIAGGKRVFSIQRFSNVVIKNNTIVSKHRQALVSLLFPDDSAVERYEWDFNHYFGNEQVFYDENSNQILSFSDWTRRFPYDMNSRYSDFSELNNHTAVIPNVYERGKAHIVVFNWKQQKSVNIDLSGLLQLNEEFKLYDVENLTEPILKGTFTGEPFSIPMDISTVIQPSGNISYSTPHTGIEFGCFFVVSDNKKYKVQRNEVGKGLTILSAYPNPTRDFFIIEYQVEKEGAVVATVFDAEGIKVFTKEEEVSFVGKKKFLLNFFGFNEGAYIINLHNGQSSDSCKVVVEP
ncbi:T9SS type A sorting domain-containing protein [Marinilabilia salmonicolor]|jgi:hypothetical protein|uniref:T9SS type A sorting domain-containing protein n=1 Tax=Marinilabilia salmonicolor TaxID=989 RepID=UPI0015E68C16|nr:T9SS type A sorting domain-containing protein [Marinilabilia salmonicolor]